MRNLVVNKTEGVEGTVGTTIEQIFEEHQRCSLLDVANRSDTEWLYVIIGKNGNDIGLIVPPGEARWWADITGPVYLKSTGGSEPYTVTRGLT